MKSGHRNSGSLERLLAAVLRCGTFLACGLIAIGLAWAAAVARLGTSEMPVVSSMHAVTLGIAVFVLLPVLRVTVMAIAFAVERDYLFVGIATLVLAIIAFGLALGAA
jgi:uncharacterized membrane protein